MGNNTDAYFSFYALMDSVCRMDVHSQLRWIINQDDWTQAKLAERLDVSQPTVNRWLGGSDPRGRNRDRIVDLFRELTGSQDGAAETDQTIVPIMGYIGAGAEVLPDFEQVPSDGLDTIQVPFKLPTDLIAFEVRGPSMIPQFRDGTIILVYKEQKRSLQTFYGEEAAVRTSDGRRFIKTIMRGDEHGNTVTLASWNAEPIENAKLEWIGEIFSTFPRRALGRVAKQGGIQGGFGV